MADEQLDAFRRLVLESPALQEQLRADDDPRTFIPLVVQLAAAHGFAFTSDDVQQALAENRRAWNDHRVV
jgi:predicted ribosomally synthesized peptide with nif11-like leader